MSLVNFELSEQRVGLLTLNNPDSLNAMDEAMAAAFRDSVASLKSKVRNKELLVLILTGAGRAFSAGGNLQMLKDKSKLSAAENKKRMLDFYDSFLCVRDLGIPVIAAINGAAVGAGLCLACACDIRIAAENSKMGFTFTKLGLHPGMGATYFLPRVIGRAMAMELLLTAKIIPAADALRIGLVSSVVATDQILSQARQIASEILSCGPDSVQQLLASLRAELPVLQDCLEREADLQSINYAGAEFMEGVTAAIEKRPAKFL